MRKKILLGLVFLVFSITAAFSEDAALEFEGRYWVTDLTAKTKVVESSIGTDFDFKSDLGMKDENFPEARVIWNINDNNKLRFAYTLVNYSGDNNITRTIEFKGQSFTIGTLVKSELDIQYFRLGWVWQLVNLLDEKVKFGTIAELKGISADISLEAPNLSPSISESQSFLGGLPTFGAALDLNPIKKINLFAEISGLPAGNFGYFFDAEAGFKIKLIKNFALAIGYRIIDIKAENDPDFVRMKISGPFFSGTFRF